MCYVAKSHPQIHVHIKINLCSNANVKNIAY